MSEQTKLIGLVVIACLILAFLWPFIRDPNFRKDLLSSRGEGSFNGFTIKGGTFLIIFVVLIGAFIYILISDVKPKEFSIAQLIEKINSKEGDYKLKNEKDTISIYKANSKLGKLNIELNEPLQTSKRNESDFWDISHKDIPKLGFIKMKHKEYHAQRRNDHNGYTIGKDAHYKIKNLDLYFIIDSVKPYARANESGYYYWVTYGEKEFKTDPGNDSEKESIHWNNKNRKYLKTKNGKLNVESSFDMLQEPHWRNNYFIGMGLGYPQTDSIFRDSTFIKLEYPWVELINVIALEYSIE